MNTTPAPARSGPAPRALVIGGGFGGLSAAIHLRCAGYDVTIFEANDRVGGRANLIEQDGFRFDTGPSLLNYPWVFEDLFRAANRSLRDYVRLLPVDPSIRFLWDDGASFTLSSNLHRLRDECERIEPGSSAGLMSFLADAEAKYDFSFRKLVRRNVDNPLAWMAALTPREMVRSAVWRSLYGELSRFFRSPRICEALGSYAMYLGGSPWTLPGLFSILPYGELAYGLWLPAGGIYGLVEAMERLAGDTGVRILKRHRVRRILVQDARATGIELADGTRVDGSVVVSNVDVPTTRAELLGDRDGGRRLRMTPGVITFYWGIRGRIDGLRHHTIFLPPDFKDTFEDLLRRKRIPENLPFYISVPSDTDASLAPPGDTAAFALVPTPRLSELGPVDWPSAVAAVRTRILDRLRSHGIAIDPGRIVLERVWTPETWGREFGLYDGSAFGATHSLFQIGPFRPPNHDRRIRGLYYVGTSTTPGTGLPMVVLGGEMTARRILSHAH
jgi:phytoene desaturase